MLNVRGKFIGFIWRKEMLDLIRDKRTLMSMILVPLLLVPLMMLLAGSIAYMSGKDLEARKLNIAIINGDNAPTIVNVISENGEKFNFLDLNDNVLAAQTMLEEGDIQAVIIIGEGKIDINNPPVPVTVMAMKNKEVSSIALRKIEKILNDLRDELVEARIQSIGAPENILNPFEIITENIASDDQMVAAALGSILPYVLILMTITGAMYPAIDMTAGEKERGTIETLLASPAKRIEIVFGKYFAIMTASIVSAIISLTSMALVTSYGTTLLGSQLGESLNFSIKLGPLFLAIAMMIPLAAFFSALLMTIAIFAKSTREAQSYLTPVMMLVIIPAMMSMMPGSEASAQQAWIPVVNVSLVMRDILNSSIDPVNLGITLLSTTLYALVMIFLTVKVFERESVLFRV
jgi:sodium transport system permease protein